MRKFRRPDSLALQQQCDQFNARYPVGQRVIVRLDSGEGKDTITRGPAYVLSGHSAVIALQGVSGCYLLDRVTAMTSEVAA